ncbi:RNA polymerase factor sigma-54 [Paenibacillus sp. GCM10023252]|uniref:RNA polymerase factor sigma-54 n=1 Tax=Paenibacillus sp. GCM10023252 TaxID=3252649 RepID=UPI00360E2F4A
MLTLSQEQTYRLALTPELRQSVHILHLSGYELIRYLEEQSQENPLLDIEYRNDSMAGARSTSGKMLHSDYDPIWRAAVSEETLEEYLLQQLRCLTLEPQVMRAASFLAGNIDEQGYLDISLQEAGDKLGIASHLMELALAQLQALEPAGVGARDFKECLLIQIRRDENAHPLAEVIIQQHLRSLAHGRLASIAEDIGCSKVEKVAAALQYIRTLNPKPGHSYSTADPHYIIPDAVVLQEDDRYVIRMNNRYLPKVSINSFYTRYAQLDSTAAYLKERMKSAEWIMRSLGQREQTLTRVIEFIINKQVGFLVHGERALKPMNLKEISESLGLHESTISRAVSNKFIKMPSGTYELKYFFSTGLQTDNGEAASATRIKAHIRSLVEKEPRMKPLSDQRICELLEADGVQISRRTVAKYREELKILPSSMRKQIG